jgi:pimeloyl-ACP methyl ester carboxylesterase
MGGQITTTKLIGFLLAALAAQALGQQPVPPGAALPLATTPLPFGSPAPPVPAGLAQAQAAYAQALALEQAHHPGSVDYYYSAISASWFVLTSFSSAAPSPLDPQAWAIYHDSLARLILEGQRHGRLDPRRGLTINTASGPLVIPTRYFGFSWKPEDFHQLLVVGDYRTKRPRHVYRRPGLGVPLVVMRYQNGSGGFLGAQHPFAATAVLRPDVRAANATDSPSAAVPGDAGPALDFCDSLTIRHVPWAGRQLDLAADISAPFALATSQADQIKLRDLLLPGSSTNPAQLLFVEPYRPGKIPVVFIHGLLSEPSTWADPVNDLRAVPQVTERFQFWDFRYPTATSFLDSAAALREQLQQAVATLDPLGTDPALRQMVLVGHSMGGLLSKLQVTSSGSAIWSRVANRPLETIVADEGTKARLRRDIFFEPSPVVRRVVFVGTPHGGSSIASNCIGRLTSWFIEPSPELVRIHQLLIQNNPNTFSPDVTDGFPNSVDLLEPTSPLLAAMQQMPVNPQVRMHSIIGHGYPMLTAGDSDGVVPVSSARHPGVQTETLVRAWHTEVHSQPETLQTLLYILSMHYADYQATVGK